MIRLKRIGTTKKPFYRIVVNDKRKKLAGRVLEVLGTYKPAETINKFKLNEERSIYWLGQGAQPSDTVKSFLLKSGIFSKFLLGKKKPVLG